MIMALCGNINRFNAALHKEKIARSHIMKIIIALILIGLADIFALLFCAYLAFRIAAEEQKDEKKND